MRSEVGFFCRFSGKDAGIGFTADGVRLVCRELLSLAEEADETWT
jgi:hypothetical protein